MTNISDQTESASTFSKVGRISTPACEYTGAITLAAALLHDLGKSSKAFQDKLRSRKPMADPVRHELLSLFIVLAAVETAIPEFKSLAPDAKNLAFVGLLEDGKFPRHVDSALGGDFVQAKVDRCLGGTLGLPTAKSHGRCIADLCGLILTHHRLASARALDGSTQATAWAYVRDGAKADRADCIAGTASAGMTRSFGSTQDVDAWKALLIVAGRRLRAALVDGRAPILPPGTVSHHGRLAMMLGDHHASAVAKRGPGQARAKGILYANTPAEPLQGPMAQSLARHLVAVAHATGAASCALARLTNGLPELVGDEIPDAIAEPVASEGRYAWQADAHRKVLERRELRGTCGFLAFVMASTGSGKTRAIPSILVAARPAQGLRYSVGLGLRSLTLQTADEYTRRLGFHRDAVSVAIGSSLARRLDVLRGQTVDASAEEKPIKAEPDAEPDAEATLTGSAVGSEADVEEAPEVVTLAGDPPVLYLPPILLRMNGQPGMGTRDARALKFLAAPLLVSTLDQLMPVATSTRGGHLTAALRTATSDLVIDEIDDFQPEDVCAICRLVEHAASHGRNVVVSSATMPPPVAEAVHAAYAHGWARHAALAGAPEEIDVAWLSDAPGTSRVTTPGPASFEESHAGFAKAVAAHVESTPWRRRLGFIPVSAAGGLDSFHAAVRDGAIRLHTQHHAIDPVTGRRVSTGVVRLANVRPAIGLARDLLEHGLGDGPEIAVVPYVGTLLPVVRHNVEATLDRALDRSGDADPLFLAGSPLRARIDAATRDDLALIVVTTSLEETGRDHDFDWAITEPGSARGLVQLSGRVRRHRGPPATEAPPNVLVTELCVRSLATPTPRRPLSRPGIETSWKNAYKRELALDALQRHEASYLFEEAGFERSITASCLISPDDPKAPIAAYERRRWQLMLDDDPVSGQGGDRIGVIRDREASYLMDAHQRWRRFRIHDGPQSEFRLGPDGWEMPTPNGAPIARSSQFKRIELADESRLLVPIDVASMTRELVSRMGSGVGERLMGEMQTITLPLEPKDGMTTVFWHEALGCAVGSV